MRYNLTFSETTQLWTAYVYGETDSFTVRSKDKESLRKRAKRLIAPKKHARPERTTKRLTCRCPECKKLFLGVVDPLDHPAAGGVYLLFCGPCKRRWYRF